MNRIKLAFLPWLVLLSGMILHCPLAEGQQPKNAKKFYVAFRMEKWKAKHIHDAAAAKKHADTLKTLGCEVKTNSHDGHIDVQCRTILWKSLALDSHDQAHQWVAWLKQAGFDTIHGHQVGEHSHASNAAQGAQREIVKYRLANWNSQHIHGATELNQLLALYRGLGCEVETHSHDGHTDVKSRCPEWMEIELPSHDAAHKWQEFLKKGGFETQHEH